MNRKIWQISKINKSIKNLFYESSKYVFVTIFGLTIHIHVSIHKPLASAGGLQQALNLVPAVDATRIS